MDEQQVRKLIEQEVAKQMIPLESKVTRVAEQNEGQNKLLAFQTTKMNRSESWQKQLWNDMPGEPPGFFQLRSQQDDKRYHELAKGLRELIEAHYRDLGRDEMQKDINKNRVDIEKIQDIRLTGKMRRWQIGLGMTASALGGAAGLHPLLTWLGHVLGWH